MKADGSKAGREMREDYQEAEAGDEEKQRLFLSYSVELKMVPLLICLEAAPSLSLQPNPLG